MLNIKTNLALFEAVIVVNIFNTMFTSFETSYTKAVNLCIGCILDVKVNHNQDNNMVTIQSTTQDHNSPDTLNRIQNEYKTQSKPQKVEESYKMDSYIYTHRCTNIISVFLRNLFSHRRLAMKNFSLTFVPRRILFGFITNATYHP